MSEINFYLDEYNRAKKDLIDKLGKYLESDLLKILNESDSIQSISWVGYTPSFNDGDPCVFRFEFNQPHKINGNYNYDYGDDSDNVVIEKLCQILGDIPRSIIQELYENDFEIILDKVKGLSVISYDCGY